MIKTCIIITILLPVFLSEIFADSNYVTYTETFHWLGHEGGDPEFVFAEFIENQSLCYVSQKFTSGLKEFFEPIIYFENGEYQIIVEKIYNNEEYKIKLFKDRLHKKKTKPRPYIQNPNPQTIIVDINGTGDYTSIQEGIDNASDGDIILVCPGTYYENIDYIGKNITIASKYYTTGDNAYIDSTVIDGDYNGSCITLNNGETDAEICGFTIQKGSGHDTGYQIFGGGIYIKEASFNVNSCYIYDNVAQYGGGLSVEDCNELNLQATKFLNNKASVCGGGISKGGYVNITFSQQDRCDIYMNYAPMGSDIYNHGGDMTVFVDTFTVQEPDKFYVYSRNDIVTMNILNHKIVPINQNVYVSHVGDNANSGLSPDEAFKNIYHALIMVKSDSTHPNIINVAEGFYSPSTTGEFFALGGKEHISIIGAGKELTVLDAEQTGRLYTIKNISEFSVENMTLQHEYDTTVGGIGISNNSNPILRNINLIDNNISGDLITTHLYCSNNSQPIYDNVRMYGNSQQVNERATYCAGQSNPLYLNCVIDGNYTNPATGHFGAGTLDDTPLLINCQITNNYGDISSAFGLMWNDDPIYFINCTIVDNKDCSEGTIRLVYNSHIYLINTILRNEPATEIWFHPSYDPNSANLEYCNIDGGIDAINTNNNGIINWGEGNIDEDPLFVGGDPFSYELTKYSPCIDAGTPDTTGLHLPSVDLSGNGRIYNGRIDIGAYEYQGYGIDEPDTNFIHNLYLFQNTPNPFTNETEILFITADYERVEDYSLSIYNAKGQLVRRFDGTTNDFWVKTKIVWDGTNEQGKQVAPGAYLYKLEYNGHAVVRKMVLLR